MPSHTFAHATGVSRLLARMGFRRSEVIPTSVRGYHRTSRGFKVVNTENGDVAVTWDTGLNVHDDEHKAQTATRISAMAETLREVGYVLSVDKAKSMILVTHKEV